MVNGVGVFSTECLWELIIWDSSGNCCECGGKNFQVGLLAACRDGDVI